MKRIKRDSIIKCIGESLILFLLGLPFVIMGLAFLLQPEEKPVALSDVDFTEDISGTYVTGTIYAVYGSYAEISENDIVVQYEYLTDAGENAYMGLRIEAADQKMVDRLVNALESYVPGNEQAVSDCFFEVTGTIRRMETEMIEIQHEALQWELMSEEEQEKFIPYYIEVGEKTTNKIPAIIALIVGLGVTSLGVWMIMIAAKDGNKLFEDYIQKSPNPQTAYQKVEKFLEEVTSSDEFVYDNDFVFGRNGSIIVFAETSKIVWVYIKQVTQKVNFITTNKNYSIMLGLMDGQRHQIRVSNQDFAQNCVQILSELCPKAVIGYTDQLNHLFEKELVQFLRLKYCANEDKSVDEVSIKEESEKNSQINKSESLVGATIAGQYKVTDFLADYGNYAYYGGVDVRGNEFLLTAISKREDARSIAQKEWFLKSAEMQAQLIHASIPKVIDAIETSQYLLLFKENVQGNNLLTIVNNMGPVPEKTVIKWGLQICDVLQYLHTMTPPRIHRDIKPANIVFQPDETIKLIDFSIMKLYDPNLKEDEQNIGTKGYAAPEQFGGRGQTDARTDIYALGMTMHHLLTGIAPYEPPYEVISVCEVNPSVSKEMERIIDKCIQVEPSQRYQSCEELFYDLNNLLILTIA